MTLQQIRAMIVDDSFFFREYLTKVLRTDPRIEVVGAAEDAFRAEAMVGELAPDVITLDMEMPKMRGPEFLRMILPKYPKTKVIVISAIPNNVFEALQAGAVDFVSKPNTRPGFDNDAFVKEVLGKIRIAHNSVNLPGQTARRETAVAATPTKPVLTRFLHTDPKAVIAVGASTGGTEAILAVLKELPENTPGIVMVQHMPPVFTKMYAERLDKICRIRVREAQDGDRVTAGTALLAPGDRQMKLASDGRGYLVRCGGTEKVSGHCPSVDVLFDSVAKTAAANAIGVILTGMGSDGAKGLLEMKKSGAYTYGQDKDTCVVYGMPMVAFSNGAVREQLPLGSIGEGICRRLMGKF